MAISRRRAVMARRIVLLMNTNATKVSNRQANRVVDEHEGDEGQQDDERDRGDADVARQAQEALDGPLPVLDVTGGIGGVVADLREGGVVHDALGSGLDLLRIEHAHDERGRKGVLAVEGGHGVRGVTVGHRGAELLERLVLGLVGHGLDVVPALDLGLVALNVRLVGVVREEGLDGHLVLDAADHAVEHGGAQDKEADDEQGQEDGDHGAEHRRPVAAEVVAALTKRVADVRGRHSNRSLPSPGRGPRVRPRAR